jgi:hypothetical protein
MIFGRIGPKIKSDMAIKNKKLNGTNKTYKESSFAFRKGWILDLGLARDQLEMRLRISIESRVLSRRCQVRNHSRPIHRGICT